MTKEEAEVLRDYLDSCISDNNFVDGGYEVKLTRTELEFIITALDEVIAF